MTRLRLTSLIVLTAGALLAGCSLTAAPDASVPEGDPSSTSRTVESGPTSTSTGSSGAFFDYREISAQYDDLQEPTGVPFHMLISTMAQGASPHDVCGRTYPAYAGAMQRITDGWPDGRFSQTVSGHEIYLDDLDAVLIAINDVLRRAASD